MAIRMEGFADKNGQPLKAVPTEYMGVRYRSRAEASFALLLDLQGHQFCYEPAMCRVGTWVPDFVTVSITPGTPGRNFPQMNAIELKPLMVSMTYLRNLIISMGALRSRFGKDIFTGQLVFGNLWEPESVHVISFLEDERQVIGPERLLIDPDHAAAIRSYRFDLQNGGAEHPVASRVVVRRVPDADVSDL